MPRPNGHSAALRRDDCSETAQSVYFVALFCNSWARSGSAREIRTAQRSSSPKAGRQMLEAIYYLLRDGEARRFTSSTMNAA